MKRIANIAFVGMLLFIIPTVSANAYHVPYADTNSVEAQIIHLEGDSNDAERLATMLQDLNLFQGTAQGFELDRQMTRAEAAVMLTRFLGGEKEAQTAASLCPFPDVPQWARGYIGWLYQNGLTKGLTETTYGAEENITGQQFATFISRVLAEDDDYIANNVLIKYELYDIKYEPKKFFRSDAVAVAVRALKLPRTRDGGNNTLAAWMIERGLFSADSLGKAAREVIRPTFDYVQIDGKSYITQYFAGVPVAHCSQPDLKFDERSFQDAKISYLIAGRASTNHIEFFSVNVETLETKKLGEVEATDAKSPDMTGYLTVSGGKVYFHARWFDTAGEQQNGPLLCWDGSALSQTIAADALDPVNGDIGFIKDSTLFIYTKDEFAYISDEKPMWQYITRSPKEKVLYINGESFLVTLTRGINSDVLACRNLPQGNITEAYDIPDDALGERPVTYGDFFFYGEGGLYTHFGKSKLIRITDQPAVAVFTVKSTAGLPSDPFIFTHALNTRVVDEIALVGGGMSNTPFGFKTFSLTTDRSGITDFKLADEYWDSNLDFTGRNGTDHGVYKYSIFHHSDNYVRVLQYTPDYGKMTDEERSQKCYAEQERIDKLLSQQSTLF